MTGNSDTTSPLDFAILAPVPLVHLVSGKDIVEAHDFVAFGSMKWDLFRQVDERRLGHRVPVLLYPSHEDVPAKLTYTVSWFGWYCGHFHGVGGAHPDGMTHRPPTTGQNSGDNQGYWAVFWHFQDLRELARDQHLRIGDVQTVKGGWRKNAPSRGPELVALPHSLAGEP